MRYLGDSHAPSYRPDIFPDRRHETGSHAIDCFVEVLDLFFDGRVLVGMFGGCGLDAGVDFFFGEGFGHFG